MSDEGFSRPLTSHPIHEGTRFTVPLRKAEPCCTPGPKLEAPRDALGESPICRFACS